MIQEVQGTRDERSERRQIRGERDERREKREIKDEITDKRQRGEIERERDERRERDEKETQKRRVCNIFAVLLRGVFAFPVIFNCKRRRDDSDGDERSLIFTSAPPKTNKKII